MKAIKRKLTKQQLGLFKNDIFRHFTKIDTYIFNGAIVHNTLLRQVHDECDRYQT